MKQRITVEQYNELSDKQIDKLLDWCSEHLCNHLLSIGRMIEFLRENASDVFVFSIEDERTYFPVYINNKCYEDAELCDNLWEAVKDVIKL